MTKLKEKSIKYLYIPKNCDINTSIKEGYRKAEFFVEENLEKETKKVLVVDDEQAIIDVLVYNLKKEGYETLEATDGVTAVNMALELNDAVLESLKEYPFDDINKLHKIKTVFINYKNHFIG